MEYQKIILLVTGLLVLIAIYLAVTSGTPPAPAQPNSSTATALLFKSSGFGKGLADYTDSYSQVSDGYKVTYTLIQSGNQRLAEVQNPLSLIKMYMLQNDTVLCITYPINESEVCSSVQGNPNMANYVSFMQSKFYNDTYIDQATSNVQYLLSKGYLSVNPNVSDSSVGSVPCELVNYTIDYRNLSLDEAAKFSISSSSPKLFYLSSCIDNSSGLPYLSTLSYADVNGIGHSSNVTVLSFQNSAQPIVLPQNETGDAVGVLSAEKEQQINLASCFTNKTGSDREKCISDLSLNLLRKDLCDLDGSRRDRCLVQLVPLTKDATICTAISDPSFKDDCYVELAGAYKDASWCNQVVDTSKLQECKDAAAPKNETNSSFNASAFLNFIDQMNSTNGTMNASGNISANATGNMSIQNGSMNQTQANATQNGTLPSNASRISSG